MWQRGNKVTGGTDCSSGDLEMGEIISDHLGGPHVITMFPKVEEGERREGQNDT